MATMTKKNEVSDGECPDGTCPLKQTSGSASGGGSVIKPQEGCRTCGGGQKRKRVGPSPVPERSWMRRGYGTPLAEHKGPSVVREVPSVPAPDTKTVNVSDPVPAVIPGKQPPPVSVPETKTANVPAQPPSTPVVVPVRETKTPPATPPRWFKGAPPVATGGTIVGGTADAAGGGTIKRPADTTTEVVTPPAVVRNVGNLSVTGFNGRRFSGPQINLPQGKPREISINLPPPAVTVVPKTPRGDVVTPKQPAPFVLAPIAPTFAPAPDYGSDPRLAGTELCRRGSDGTFPTVSSACAQSFRDLLSRGLSVAEIISGNELCSDEFRRLLAGATPALIEPPKQGVAAVESAKGMPLAVAAPTMIVAPGGAPSAVNPVQCMALFLTLPSSVQAAIVGSYGCPQAQLLAPEIARGSRAAAADFVQWFGSAFRPESAEVSRFCAAVLNARGVAAAGAPGGILVEGRAYVPPAGAPGGKSMVLQGPRASNPFAQAGYSTASVPDNSRVIGPIGTPRSPSSVAPGTAAVGAPSTAQCIAALRAIASRDPRAIVAAFHQSGLDAIVPSRPGSGNAAADVLALIDDCAARRQQYPRQFDSFCRIAQALSPSKPGGYATRPAGDPPPVDMTFSTAEQQQAQWLQGLQGGGLGPATQGTAVGQGDVAYRPPADPGITTTQILSGLGSVATTGIGVLNTYLDRESRQHIAELAANASSANAQIAAQAQRDIAQIQADAQVRIAALGPNPSPSAVAGALNTATNPSTATQPPSQGMSTGTVAAIGVGAVAVAGIAYLALSKKGR